MGTERVNRKREKERKDVKILAMIKIVLLLDPPSCCYIDERQAYLWQDRIEILNQIARKSVESNNCLKINNADIRNETREREKTRED